MCAAELHRASVGATAEEGQILPGFAHYPQAVGVNECLQLSFFGLGETGELNLWTLVRRRSGGRRGGIDQQQLPTLQKLYDAVFAVDLRQAVICAATIDVAAVLIPLDESALTFHPIAIATNEA